MKPEPLKKRSRYHPIPEMYDRSEWVYKPEDIRSVVEWLMEEKKKLDRLLLLKKITQFEYQVRMAERIRKAFEDVMKQKECHKND